MFFTITNALGQLATLLMLTPITSASLLSSGNGVSGLGLSLFTPTCCYSCLNTLWALRLPCSQPNPNQTLAINSPQCHASSEIYLESLAWCMKLKCPGEGVSDAEVGSVWNKIAGDGVKVGEWQSYLAQQPSNILTVGAVELAQPSLIDQVLYEHSRDTVLSYASQDKYHEIYSVVLVTASIAIAALIGVKLGLDRLTGRVLHRKIQTPFLIRKHFLVPALFGKRHMRILPWNLGYVPQRSTSILICIFVIVNIIFNFFNIPSFNNDTWYVSDSALSISNLANRLGVLAIANLSLAILLSGRSSIIMYMTGCSRTTLLAFHRWAGRVAVVKGIAHSAIYLSSTDKYGVGTFTPAGALLYIGCEDPYWVMGIASLAIFGAILFFSLAPIRIPWYEAFLITHVALAVAGLVTLWYHLKFRFHGQYRYEVWLYIAFGAWILERLVRAIRLVCLNYGLCTGRTPAALIELLPGDDFIKVTAFPSCAWSIQPGEYCFVYFPALTLFWESHPFSIASWSTGVGGGTNGLPKAIDSATANEVAMDKEQHPSAQMTPDPPAEHVVVSDARSANASISFIIRPCSGITKRLRASFTGEKRKLSIPVLIEGPYGRSPADRFSSPTIIAFAGGIGITGVLGYVHAYVSKSKSPASLSMAKTAFRTRKFTLFWLARSRREIDAISPLLPDEPTMAKSGIQLQVSSSDERTTRLDFGQEIRKEQDSEDAGTDLTVISCGPPTMSDEIRKCVAKAEGRNGARIALIEEAFAW